MDAHRANEIMDSYGVINVFYKGHPIWIEQVKGDVAQVQDMANHKRLEVDLVDLVET